MIDPVIGRDGPVVLIDGETAAFIAENLRDGVVRRAQLSRSETVAAAVVAIIRSAAAFRRECRDLAVDDEPVTIPTMTTSQIAKAASVTTRNVRERIRCGTLPGRLTSRGYVVDRDAAEQWIERRR